MTEEQTAKPAPSRLLTHLEPLLLAVAVLYLLVIFFLSHVEGDQAFLLYAAGRVLDGVHLDGPRLIETNPPLIVWFNLIPAGIARLLHIDPVVSLKLVATAMWAGSAAWSSRILRLFRVPATLGEPATRLLWGVMYLAILLTQPAEFGQREQLLMTLLLPYLLAVSTGAVQSLRTGERIALGLAAGLAVCFKPHHVLTLVALELFLAVWHRSLRRLLTPELLASVAAGLIYLAAVRLLTPVYMQVIVPLLTSTYWALGQFSTLQMVLRVGLLFTVLSVVMSAMWLLVQRRLRLPEVSGAVVATALGATGAYFVQHTGWYHQSFPATVLFEIGAAWITADLLSRVRPPVLQFRRARVLEWVGFAACALLAFAVVARRPSKAVVKPGTISAELASLPAGTTVYIFTVNLNEWPVILHQHLLWGSRFAHLWMLPAIQENEMHLQEPGSPFHALPPARVEELATLQRRETVEDLESFRPQAVFVERCEPTHTCAGFRAPFHAVEWFSQSPDFTRVWSGYQFSKRLDSFDLYTLKQ